MEANNKGIEDMQRLFAEQNIPKRKYDIFQCKIEDYNTERKYDIVIAEGFLPYLKNQKEVIERLQGFVVKNGIIVVTCSDDVCMFIEAMKRLIGIMLTVDIPEYDQKVDYLEKLFQPQLNQLRGVSRSAREWVQDQILNPAGINGMELSMWQAINLFEAGFDILGSSPNMFTDYSWYKDVWYDYIDEYKTQFEKKRLSLLQAGMPEIILPIDKVNILEKSFKIMKKAAAKYEDTLVVKEVDAVIMEIDCIHELIVQNFDRVFINVLDEIKEALLCCLQRKNFFYIEDYPHFMSAFERAQQYVSFVKKRN